jgi:phosphoenolpyruvate carboxykinase (ATP)
MTLMKIKRTKRFTSNAFHLGLDKLGIENKSAPCFQNLSYDEIASHERSNGEGLFIKNGAFAVDTGKFTGRSPMDKYIVEQSPSKNNIWWGQVNRPMKPETFDKLYKKVTTHFTAAGVIYVFDGYCGAHKSTQKKVRFITELAWQHHFVTNMFIRPTRDELQNFQPDFTVINACKVTNPSYRNERLNSEVFITFNIEKNVALIGGTYYGGEMKKGIFSMMNYWLPLEGIMSMHCSANVGPQGDSALFFGLSGTGKTTLSADPKRLLIGDDEHGWDDEGIFNFEGGCYAKTINLTEEHEPEIFRAIQRDALLENCYIVPGSHEPDYTNITKTENGRVSYPIYHIKNHKKDSKAGHPTNCIFLTCDAYGVLPPVSRLSSGQAQYHFLSGYTAKVAGTERGVTEPQATFSACFGAAFLPLHPTKYADLLQKKLQKYGTKVFLVNTGWSGGSYGSGKRLSLKVTRQCIDAILDGSINKAHFYKDPVFGFDVPKKLGSLSAEVLCPRAGWQDKTKYDETARKLADSFKENFKQFVRSGFTDYSSYGPN